MILVNRDYCDNFLCIVDATVKSPKNAANGVIVTINLCTICGNSDTIRDNKQLIARSSARIEHRFPKPLPDIHKLLKNKGITEKDKIDLALNLALLLQESPDLARLIKVWPSLPDNIRQEIMDLVKTYDDSGDGLSE
jgi:hypothetical protein